MNAELWRQVREAFHAAVELSPAERSSFLSETCTDPALRREVESLLASYGEAGELMEVPALELSAETGRQESEDPWVGSSIGPYEVIARLGQGGMGTVYRAVRLDDQYVKQVAIKLVRSGFDSDIYLRRLRNERQIMASLDHPNIARLLDGGTTKGVPYFVMEYIEGKRIDEYCDAHKLNTVGRLKLFCRVCEAVQYAHQHLVVHRDLKPGNILITAEGVPKLLDFGIAKLLEPELFLQATALTVSHARPMTPEVASPEQIRGEAVTTLSDVYSLGILLYRLLPGHSPYRIEGQPIHEIARAISETEPMRPSVVIDRVTEENGADGTSIKLSPEIVSRSREGHPQTLRDRLEGDLDNILLKALRKEPSRRYASVEQFAEDIQRHLDGRPVLARKDTIRYRTVKFVKRNKIGVAAAALIVLSLVGGILATARQAHIARMERRKAEQRFHDIRDLANSLIFKLDAAIETLPGATPARKILVDDAVRHLDTLSQEARDDMDLQRELAAAYKKLGDVQGNPFRANLGDTAAAVESYQKVAALREGLAATNAQSRDDKLALSDSYLWLGQMRVFTGDLKGGLSFAVKSLGILQPLAQAEPDDPAVLDKLENAYEVIGDIQGGNGLSANLGDTDAALESHGRALAIAKRLAEKNLKDPKLQRSLAIYRMKVADDQVKQGQRAAAIKSYNEALDIYRTISAGGGNTLYLRETTVLLTRIGDAQLMDGNSRAAFRTYRESMDIAEGLAVADPKNALAQEDLAIGYAMMGKASADSGNRQEGLLQLNKAIALIEADMKHDPNHSARKRIAGLLYVWRGEVLAAAGAIDKALVDYEKTAAIMNLIANADSTDVDARLMMAAANAKIGDALAKKGKVVAAQISIARRCRSPNRLPSRSRPTPRHSTP